VRHRRHSIERITTDANVHPRTGFSLGLGCILRYVGSMGSSTRHLKSTIEILQALTKDATPVVCSWSLYSLMLTVNAAGQALDPFLDPIIKVSARGVHTRERTHQTIESESNRFELTRFELTLRALPLHASGGAPCHPGYTRRTHASFRVCREACQHAHHSHWARATGECPFPHG
jgi:hypothetical protein